MLVVRRTEDPADPICQLKSAEQSLGLDHFAFGVDPLGLYRIEPRALRRQQAGHYSYSGFATAIFDLAVVGADPVAYLMALVPACVVPDQEQGPLASRPESAAAPPKELRGYGAHGATIHEPQPRLLELRQIKPVAGEGLRLGIVLARLLLEEAHRLARLLPRMQARPLKTRKPGLVLEAQNPLRMGLGKPDQPISSPFFLSYSGSGLSIHLFARSQRTPSRDKVARMVSPVTLLSVMPSSKLTSVAIASVQSVLPLPKFLGFWCRISRSASVALSSNAAWTSLGREEPALRAPRPRSWKSWMALRTVCCPHPRLLAMRGECSPRELARRIWQRRRTKASEERNPASSSWRSSFESVRTNMGGFMGTTVTHHSQP